MTRLRYTLAISVGAHLAPLLVFASVAAPPDLEIRMGEVAVEVEWLPAPEPLPEPAKEEPEPLPVTEPIPELPDPAEFEVPLEEPVVEPLPQTIKEPDSPPQPDQEIPPAPPSPNPVEHEGLEEAMALEGNLPPPYPAQARRRGQEGRVVIRLTIGEDGVVRGASVETGSGNSAFDEAALKALCAWKFSPERRWGKAVVSELLVPVEFRLKDKN